MKTEQEKNGLVRNKKIFLNELKGAFAEIKQAGEYASKTGLQFPEAFDVVKKNGGARPKRP